MSVWDGISPFGHGDNVKISGTPTKEKYKQILQHHAVPHGNRLIGKGFLFQQDHDPKHTSNVVKQYLENKITAVVLQMLEWPPQSPDMNPIEAIWDFLETEKNKRNSTNFVEQWNVRKDIWHNIPVRLLQSHTGSMVKE